MHAAINGWGGCRSGALIVALALAGCRGSTRSTGTSESTSATGTTGSSPNPAATYREHACDAAAIEPWPDPTYHAATGESPFGIVAVRSGVQRLSLERIGKDAIVVALPKLYTLSSGAARALPDLPAVDASAGTWQIEGVAGTPALLVVELDVARHYGGPSQNRRRVALDAGGWHDEVRDRDFRRVFTWANGRVVDYGAEHPTWLLPTEPTPFEFGPMDSKCVDGQFMYVDAADVVGDVTFVSGRRCRDYSWMVTRIEPSATNYKVITALPFKMWERSHAIRAANDMFFAGISAEGSKSSFAEFAPKESTKSEAEWQRVEGPSYEPRSVAYAADGSLWLAAGAGGDIGSRDGSPGPAPAGDVFRRTKRGAPFERVAMPHHPIDDGWTEIRFVAETIVPAGNDLYVSGYWYYTRKPQPTTMQTTHRWGLLRLDHKAPPVDL